MEQLEGHLIAGGVARQEDRRHSSGAQLPLDLVASRQRGADVRDHVGLHPLTPPIQEPQAYRATVEAARGMRSA